jgi:adenylate cyclase
MALVGNLGSEQIFDYTAIGDTVNLGARLEALNKNYKTKNTIIISEFTLEHVKDYIEYEYLDEVIVKGKTKSIKIYQLVSLKIIE